MIPILYEKGEIAFTSNGLGRLADCISCTVTEERNGIYECQFTYPVSGAMYSQITEGRILGVIHDDAHDIQPFDIYGRSAPINGTVTFYAHHISYRLGNVILKPMSAASCAAAMAAIPSNTYNACPFTFWTDKSASATFTNAVPSAVRAILGGQAGSILDVYGKGDYEFDKWTVKLHLNRGNDNGVAIRYGVNLTDLTQNVDVSSAYTAVVPYWLGAEGDLVTLPEGYVACTGMAVVPVPLDLSADFDEMPTVEQLRTKATARLESSRAWLPNENIRVSFIDLSHTEEYKNVAALQRVCLCDSVSVYCGDLDIYAVSMKVVRVVFNVLTEMYDEIELGDPRTTLAQTIAAQFEEVTADLPTTEQVRSMLSQGVENATAQITGALGGFVRFIYDANGKMQEIVIMDTDDISTAHKVWRWNSGGLGYSSNGYNGPYGTAITQDGAIVADYITSGVMNADLIRAGTITSPVGGTYWDLDNGIFVIGSNANIGGMSAGDIVDSIGSTVTAIDIEYAHNQDSSTAPTSGWSTVAPSWAAGWYIWQRTKMTTPDGVEYSEPTCISGRDGSSATPGLNQATLYLYRRAATQPSAPATSMTYTFASGELTGIPGGWFRAIPSGSDPCWVTSAAAISTDTAVTLTSNAWQTPVMLAYNGAAVANVVTLFAVSDSTIPPATSEFHELGEEIPWTDDNDNIITDDNDEPIYFMVDESPVPTSLTPYVWTFQRTTYTDGTVLDSTKAITAVYGEQGIGVAAIVEQYYLSTSDEEPTGGAWSERQPVWQPGTYIWTRSRITWTDDAVTTTEPVLARAINAANEAAAQADAKAESASAREQIIYHSAVSGTITMAANTTWVENSANAQNVWTTTRPVYNGGYPVLFVATQRQSVEQRAGTTCSCTTPVIDQTTTVIDGGHISTGTIDAGVVNVTNLKAGNITSGTLSADRIGASSITAGKIAAGAITADKIAAGAITADKLAAAVITSINNAQSTADSANSLEQLVYRSAAAGTSSMAAPTSWVSNSTGNQNTWTIKRPQYSSSYPVLFVATQRKTVDGTVTCTTPQIDQTTTVIDGGNIITGSITSGKIAAGAITSNKLDSDVITSINTAQSTANGANSLTQTIYKQAVSGTGSMSGTTTWVTATGESTSSDTAGLTPVWTTKRPTYRSKYPVIFVATQRKTVEGTVTCTTPLKDDTMTVIDGGHITTGAIDAGRISTGTLDASKITVTNLDGGSITAGSLSADKIKGGTLVLGGANNTNGYLSIKDASNNTIGRWDKDGIEASLGSLAFVRRSGNYSAKLNLGDSYTTLFSYTYSSSTMTNKAELKSGSFNMSSNSSERYEPGIRSTNSRYNWTACLDPREVSIGNSSSPDFYASIINGYLYCGVKGDLTVNGTKSRSVSTDQYSDRLLYCYETPSPMFGDIGEGVIGEDGFCYIPLDAVFAQTVTTAQYQVFLQKYGDGDCWVMERRGSCFIVRGTPGLVFGWEIKARQRDFDQLRLEKNVKPFAVPDTTYGEDAAQHIMDIQKEREIA